MGTNYPVVEALGRGTDGSCKGSRSREGTGWAARWSCGVGSLVIDVVHVSEETVAYDVAGRDRWLVVHVDCATPEDRPEPQLIVLTSAEEGIVESGDEDAVPEDTGVAVADGG